MSKAYIFFADGFEDVEGLMVVDLLRRAGIDMETVSIKETPEILTSHRIRLYADCIFTEKDFGDADLLVLPGGMPGTAYLKEYEPLRDLLLRFHEKKGLIGAICAAPTVLSSLGLLKDRRATSYPSCQPDVDCAQYLNDAVVIDGNIITSRGLGTAADFALALISLLEGEKKAKEIAESVVYEA